MTGTDKATSPGLPAAPPGRRTEQSAAARRPALRFYFL